MDVFSEALEFGDAAERAAFLDKTCGDDADLRGKVERLLAAHEALETSGGFMSGKGEEAVEENTAVGRYKLLQKIGEGGWGIVYMAEQAEPVRRRVALKILKPGMDTRQVIARFEAERQALAMMDHPNIARVLDAGATEAGRPYFVMELVRGIRITDYCDKNRLPTTERLELFTAVCQAVQHAHQKGIIHRDIKPSNILVTSDDGKPVPKVIDFGVAKATADVRLTDKTLFTRFEMFVGTPAYMSPEQAEFSAQGVDTRADIYALGVLLYELLTSRTPFDAERLISSGVDAMRRTIREEEPPKPSTRLRLLDDKTVEGIAAQHQSERLKLIAEVQGDLDWIVLKALEKDRTRRYDTATGLGSDVQRYLNHEPVSARPPSAAYTFRKWARRHRGVIVGGAAVLASLLLGLAASTWLAWRATAAEKEQRLLREKSDQDRAAADAALAEALVRAYAADMKAAAVAIAEGNSGQANALLDRYAPTAGGPDVRGFEWHVLHQRAAGDEIASFDLTGINAGTVLALDNSWVAAGAKFGDVRVWDTATGKLIQTFPALKKREPRRSMALSPDGTMLAYISDDSVWVRGTARWEVLREIPVKANVITFAPGGQLVWGAMDGLHFLDPHTFAEASAIAGISLHAGAVISFTADGSQVGLLVAGNGFEIWNTQSKSRRQRPDLGENNTGILSPDGRLAALGNGAGDLMLWDVAAEKLIAKTHAHASWLLAAAFSADSTQLITGGGDQTLRRWDLATTKPLAKATGSWSGHWNEVWTVEFSRDGQRLVSGGKDGRVKVWNAKPPAGRVLEVPSPGQARLAGFSSDGSQFRLQLPDGIQFRNVTDGTLAREWIRPPEYPHQHGYFSGDRVLLCGTDGSTSLLRLPDGERLQHIDCNQHPAAAVAALSPDGRIMVTLRKGSGVMDVWDFTSGKWLGELPGYMHSQGSPAFHRLCFSPDGKRLAYTATDRRVLVYDLQQQKVVHELSGFAWHLYAVAWSPDGRWLVTSSWDGTVAVWNPETGQRALPELRGHFAGVPALTFSADSRTLVTHGAERTLRFWNLPTGTEVLTLHDAEAYWGCPISPDARTLLWRRSSDKMLQVEKVR